MNEHNLTYTKGLEKLLNLNLVVVTSIYFSYIHLAA